MSKKLKILLNIVVFFLFIYLYTQLDYQAMVENLRNIPIMILVVLVFIQLVDMALVNYQNLRLAKTVGYHMSFWKMYYITSLGHVFDALTPGGGIGGEAVKIMMLKKHADVPYSTGTAIVLSQKTISTCALMFFCLLAFGYMTGTSAMHMSLWLKIGIFALLFGILFLAIYIFYRPRTFMMKCEKIRSDKIRESLISFLEGIAQISANRKECMIQIFISFFIWFIYPIRLFILLEVTKTAVPFVVIYAVIFLAYGTAMIPIFPGGMLGFEASMSAMLTLYGVASDKSIFITTLFRFLTFWFVIVVSFLYIGGYKFCGLFRREPKRELKKPDQGS